MVSVSINGSARFFRASFRALLFLALSGCISEDIIEPQQAEPPPVPPPIPAPSCSAFVISGYTDRISYYTGEKIQVFIESNQGVALCGLTIFTVMGDSIFSVPAAVTIAPTLSADASQHGFNYTVAAEFMVPELKSGVYLIEDKIPFIIKTDGAVDVMVVYPSNTANAYATSGGKNFYSAQQRPPVLSFQRPIPLQSLSEVCLRWFSTLRDISVGYVADVDMDAFENIRYARMLVVPGHSEYWTRAARKNFDAFVNAGGDALILSGNTMWWQVRYSEDGTKLICYKDSVADPLNDPTLKTIQWSSPSLDYSILSSIGAHFPNGGYGLKNDLGWNGYKIVTPESPLFEGLGLNKGDILPLPSLEYDGSPISGFDSAGYPIIDKGALGFEKIELLAFDKGYRAAETVATFIVFQKTREAGVVINTASTDWCSSGGMGGMSGNAIRTITHNAMKKLLNNDPVFTQ